MHKLYYLQTIKNKTYCSFIFCLLLVLVLPSETNAQDTIKPKYSLSTIPEFWNQMDDIFNDPSFSSAHWGVLIQSLETGEYFYKRNEDKLFVPASNLKLFTTAAGLVLLGDDYKFSTNVFSRGKIDGSSLDGDIIIQGRGDPSISGRFYDGNELKVFEDWADTLLQMGIDEIKGNIIGDDNEFDDIGLGTGWSWDNESYWYSAQSSAISFNENCIDINVSVNGDKNTAKVKIFPDTKYVVIVNNVVVVPADSSTSIDVYREIGTNVITVTGTIQNTSDTVKTYCTINNPTQYSMVIFKDVLEKKGIAVKGYAVDIDDIPTPIEYNKTSLLFTHYSPPLRELIKIINKQSRNFFAEQLLKTIGLEELHYGSAENGIDAQAEIFRDMGINTDGLKIVDGSGLSRMNLVSPRNFVTLLNYIFKSKHFVPFYNSLPIAGIDGTLGTRMKNTRAEGKVRAKTGFLESIRSLSGYTYTGDNEPVAFSIIGNNFNVPVKLAENLQDLVCLRLVNFRRK